MRNSEERQPDEKQCLMARLKRFARYWYLRLVRIQATPPLPFQTALAVALAFIVQGIKIASALGSWVSNPLNWLPFYLLFYKIGKAVAPFDVPWFRPSELEMIEMLEILRGHAGKRLDYRPALV